MKINLKAGQVIRNEWSKRFYLVLEVRENHPHPITVMILGESPSPTRVGIVQIVDLSVDYKRVA